GHAVDGGPRPRRGRQSPVGTDRPLHHLGRLGRLGRSCAAPRRPGVDRGWAPGLPGLAVSLRPAGALSGGQSVCQARDQPWILLARQPREVLSAAVWARPLVRAGADAGGSLGRYVGLLRLPGAAAPGATVAAPPVKRAVAGRSKVHPV